MATVEKDFKVKNGLVVTNGGTFGDAVTVGAPTLAGHAATKEYVIELIFITMATGIPRQLLTIQIIFHSTFTIPQLMELVS